MGEISLATQAARYVTWRSKCINNRSNMYFNRMCNPRKKISGIEPSECPQLKSLGNGNEALKFRQAKNARAMYKTVINLTSTSLRNPYFRKKRISQSLLWDLHFPLVPFRLQILNKNALVTDRTLYSLMMRLKRMSSIALLRVFCFT